MGASDRSLRFRPKWTDVTEAAAWRGELGVGAMPDGGFRVWARLPVAE